MGVVNVAMGRRGRTTERFYVPLKYGGRRRMAGKRVVSRTAGERGVK